MKSGTHYWNEELRPIQVPPGWTRAQDLEHFRDRYFEDYLPGEELVCASRQLALRAAELKAAMGAVWDRVFAGEPAKRVAADLLSDRDGIEVVGLFACPPPTAFRFPQAMRFAQFAVESSGPTLAKLTIPGTPIVTLFEVCESADRLGTAAHQVSEALRDWPLHSNESSLAA